MRFASAGHPSPFLIRRAAGVVEPLKFKDPRHGPALGLFGTPLYPTCQVPLQAQDLVLLFTDGIYEANNARYEEYGQARLLSVARRQLHLPTGRLLDELLKPLWPPSFEHFLFEF